MALADSFTSMAPTPSRTGGRAVEAAPLGDCGHHETHLRGSSLGAAQADLVGQVALRWPCQLYFGVVRARGI